MKQIRLFVFLGLTLALTCCAQEPAQQASQADFGGEAFYFIQSFIPGNSERDKTARSEEFPEDTAEADAMYTHCAKVEQLYNCRIIRQPELGQPSGSAFAAAYAAGELPADIICGNSNLLLDLYQSGILADLHTIEAIDTNDEEKWGIKAQRTCTTKNGVLYAFPLRGSRYMPVTRDYFAAFACNMDIYEQFGQERTPREMVEQGDWTFDGFYELLQNVYDPDPERRIYGLALYNSIVTASVYANGGDFVVKQRGRYVFGYSQPNALRALAWAQRVCRPRGMIGDWKDFENGRATFMLGRPEQFIYSSLTNLMWLPFPYGPDVAYGSACVSYFGSYNTCTAILKNEDAAHTQRTGVIFDALFSPTEHFGKDGYDKYVERNLFYTSEDYAVYKYNTDHMHYDWSKEFSGDETLKRLSDVCDEALGSNQAFYTYLAPFTETINEIALQQIGRD